MKKLQAGALTAGYDNGSIRRISYGGNEVVRMIYFALRDHNWNTIPFQLENENISIDQNSFQINYDCFNRDGGITVLEWKASITGKADGTIIFELHGLAKEDFRKSRAGFCVLHPLNITGQACNLIHPDGSESTHAFPVEISPDNPFKNIQGMSWQTSGTPFSLVFEGDVFETEDQRNWSDASFKTFCTPLDKPFPVLLKKGSKIFQRITFSPGQELQPVAQSGSHISLTDSGINSVLPFLGVAASTEHHSLPENATALLRRLNLRHYRIDLYPGAEGWVGRFSEAYETAFALGLPLEVALHLTDNFKEEIQAFIILCKQNKVKLRRILLLQTNALVTGSEVIGEIPVLKEAFQGSVAVGAGTNYNFNELNKHHFEGDAVDFVSFSVDPQEHAFDDITILENMESLEHLVQSAKGIYGQAMPVNISPLTLRKRFNPYATNPADQHIEESRKADPRQKQPFAALWTFGSLRNLAKGGAQAVTLYQTIGNQGVLSAEGDPYPVYDLLKNVSSYQGKAVRILDSTDPHAVQGMVFDEKLLALANFTGKRQDVRMGNKDYELSPQEVRFEPLNRT